MAITQSIDFFKIHLKRRQNIFGYHFICQYIYIYISSKQYLPLYAFCFYIHLSPPILSIEKNYHSCTIFLCYNKISISIFVFVLFFVFPREIEPSETHGSQ